MKRSPIDILRRGFDNVVANWPLLFVRMAEAFALVLLALVLLALAALPAIAYVGVVDLPDFETLTPDEFESIAAMILGYWGVALYAIVAISFALLILVLVHSFFEAGMLRIYVDGERTAGAAIVGDRQRFRAYTFERFWAGAKSAWLTIFWIYNLVWSVWGLIVLVPLLATLAGVLLMREEQGAALALGCAGLAITFIVMIPSGIVVSLWSTKAIVTAVARDTGARESMRIAWHEVKTDFVRHLAVTVIVIVVSMAASGFVSSFGYMAGISFSDSFRLLMIPLQLMIWIVSTFLNGASSSWLAASYAAITPEPKP